MGKVLLALLLSIILSFAFCAQAREPELETASASSIQRSNTFTYITYKTEDLALDASSTQIIEPSVFEDCNTNPEKYDIYDGIKTVETSSCFSNACWTEETTLHGISMQPTLLDDSTLYIRHDSRYNLSVGKIIAYDSLGQTSGAYSKNTIHQIVGIEPKGAATLNRIENKYQITVPIENGYITYTWNSSHFLTNISDNYYVTKGAANDFCELIPENAIRGILVD